MNQWWQWLVDFCGCPYELSTAPREWLYYRKCTMDNKVPPLVKNQEGKSGVMIKGKFEALFPLGEKTNKKSGPRGI